MKTNKIIASFLALAMSCAVSMSFSAYAAEINQNSEPQSGDTTVSFTVDPSYTITIPATIELKKVATEDKVTYEGSDQITAEAGMRLKSNQSVEIKIESDFEMEGSAGTTLTYRFHANGGDVFNGGTVGKFTTDTEEQSVSLKFIAKDPQYAGTYTDTVTFFDFADGKIIR